MNEVTGVVVAMADAWTTRPHFYPGAMPIRGLRQRTSDDRRRLSARPIRYR